MKEQAIDFSHLCFSGVSFVERMDQIGFDRGGECLLESGEGKTLKNGLQFLEEVGGVLGQSGIPEQRHGDMDVGQGQDNFVKLIY